MLGIVTYKDPAKKVLYNYGTLVGVASESPIATSESLFSGLNVGYSNQNGWKLVVIGVERFKILSSTEENGTTYATIHIEKDKDSKISDQVLEQLRNQGKSYFKSLAMPDNVTVERENFIESEKDPLQLGFYIAGHLDIPIADKQLLLENFKLEERSVQILSHISTLLAEDQLSKEISEKMKKGISRKMEIRQKEIESKFESTDEHQKLENTLKAIQLPNEYKKTILEEMKNLKTMKKFYPEYSMLRNYLDTVASLPWGISSQDNYNLKHAKEQLDSDHFGLEKVKKRILEFIAVRGLRNDMKGSILCFTGPPGVGKTSLGKSIADSIGRKFVRISLGGVRDEAEIRGHRRTYVGSMPGVLIKVKST